MDRDTWRHRLGQARGGEEGSAIIEFIFLGVLMLVPLIYLVMTLGRVQAGSYAVTTAAREAGRAFVTAQSGQDAAARAQAASEVAFVDQGFGGSGTMEIVCSTSPCLTPEARIETTARVIVPLPLIPGFARDVVPLEIPLTASHLSTVDRFRGSP
ncbi:MULTISPECIES: TadE/TadG family type IV pilus assembly protein [unclassified Knoellia]|uniref:TadE/TadG family type IV pilus assembly protein n=1 Tax=Knoellia altitudinis TaxID=3404795 RepID=UPI003610B45A